MTTAATNARFSFNNYLESPFLESSGDKAGYPAANIYHALRGKLWKPSNVYEIHAKNCKVYINAATYTLAVGTYTSATLITEFNLKCTAAGAVLSLGDGDRWRITFGASKTLNISNQTDSIWDTLGFLGTTDRTGTILQGDKPRYNTGSWLKIDLGLPQECNFAAIIGEANSIFGSSTATIKLQGNNLDYWLDPLPVDLEMEVSDQGAFIAPVDAQQCRFWRIFIDDRGNNDAKYAVAYLGSSVIPQNTNIATGFNRNREDQSVRLYSEAGALYVDRRPKVMSLSSLGVQFLKDDELIEMEQLFYDLGVENPFFLCIDPQKQVSGSLAQMTHYVAVTSPLQLQHVLRGYYNLAVELREVL